VDLSKPFEAQRSHLRNVAYRMLGSLAEADDAVQEAWLRLSRADTSEVSNLAGWLTTVVARVCLDMLRSRKSRREDELEPAQHEGGARNPAEEAALADSVGLALLVVLDTLDPPERLAFVLHDMFALPFEEIAPIVGRTPTAARQLASRARRRLQGDPSQPADRERHRATVEAFLTALRAGDFDGLVAVLDPAMVARGGDAPAEVRGAETWARGAVKYGAGARFVRTVLIDGAVGAVLAPKGKLTRALRFTFSADGDRIAGIEVVTDAAELAKLELAVL